MLLARSLMCCLMLLTALPRAIHAQPPTDLIKPNAVQNAPTGPDLIAQLTDNNGSPIHTKSVTVFLCDGTTGYPIDRQTKSPISTAPNETQLDHVWYELTNNDGVVSFHSPMPGNYRLVAMSWPGVADFKELGTASPPTREIQLHGIVENAIVPTSSPDRTNPSEQLQIKPMGSHSLRIDNDPAEPHGILIISLKPTLGDGILGPYGWGKEFCRHWIGVTQMEIPHVTIRGLPDDSDIHVSLINYDNNPGVAAASYPAKQKHGKLRIIATWSNGHKSPPANLLPIIQHLEKHSIQKQQIVNQLSRLQSTEPSEHDETNTRKINNEQFAMLAALAEDNDTEVDLAEYGKVRLADIIAAFAYIDLQRFIGNGSAQRQKP